MCGGADRTEHFHVTIGAEDTKKEVLSTFISQYYAGTPFVPKEIMLPMEIEDADVVHSGCLQNEDRKYISVCLKRDSGKNWWNLPNRMPSWC